ncbi:MAG: hypothetical protein ACI4B3_09210 [Prevotella sp.]
MKKIILSFSLFIAASIIVSCGESGKEKSQRKIIDSLETVNAQGRMDYEDLQEYLSVIAEGLDSISIEEHELLVNTTPGENMGLNRQRMKQNLSHVREILARHRFRIEELEKKLESGNSDARNLRTIITALRQQLDAKDRELAKLKSDLDDNRKSIAMLTSQVQQISEEKEKQAKTIQTQQKTIERQTEKLNSGYIIIASKKELKESGLLTGGFLKKTKIDYSKMDISKFQSVDIRTLKKISIPRKAKILSSVPSGSYSIKNGSNEDVIQILDQEKFWSVSNFLIIQTN